MQHERCSQCVNLRAEETFIARVLGQIVDQVELEHQNQRNEADDGELDDDPLVLQQVPAGARP